MLYEWLKTYGFTAWEDIYSLTAAQSGKRILSEKYILSKNRDYLLLSKIVNNSKSYEINKTTNSLKVPLNVTLSKAEYTISSDRNSIFVDEDLLEFPLTLRKWEQGDIFYPSGMKGKKKLSKYFKDEKFSLVDKERQWLLISNEKVVWVIGKRADQRFLANKHTQHILKIEIKE